MIDFSQTSRDNLLAKTQRSGSNRTNGDREPVSIAALLSRLFADAAALLRNEVALAKAEARESAGVFLAAATWIGAAVVVLWTAFLALTASAVIALAAVVPLWLAALIVAVALGLVGVILLLASSGKIRQTSVDMNRTRSSLQKDSTLMARNH